MPVTLEQARALDALERHKTFTGAATALRKAHTAVMYALKTLEQQTGVAILDRRGYRTELTPTGRRVLEHCRRLLAAERDLEAACHQMRTGWEASLYVVMDGIFPVDALVQVVSRLAGAGAPTRIQVVSEFLAGVEAAFVRDDADLMISVLPPAAVDVRSEPLGVLDVVLLAHKDHALGRARGPLETEALASSVLLTVRGSDPRLQLPTAGLDQRSTVHLSDFNAKKAAIMAGAGFGWLPEYLAAKELRRGTLRKVPWRHGNRHRFHPRLYYRADREPGRGATAVIEALRAERG